MVRMVRQAPVSSYRMHSCSGCTIPVSCASELQELFGIPVCEGQNKHTCVLAQGEEPCSLTTAAMTPPRSAFVVSAPRRTQSMTLALTALSMTRGPAAKVTWETMVTRATKEMKGRLKKVLAQVLCCFCECQSNVHVIVSNGQRPRTSVRLRNAERATFWHPLEIIPHNYFGTV